MRLGSITAMLPVLLMLSGRGVHGQETSAALRAGVEVSRPLPADSIHTYTLSASEGQLVRLHIEPFPRMFFVRVLDGSGAMVTDAAAWCSSDPPCTVPVLTRPEYRVEVRPYSVDFPQWRERYPKDASYRLRLERAPDSEAAAVRGQIPTMLDWVGARAHRLQAVEGESRSSETIC